MFWKTIKRLKFNQLLKLAGISLMSPLRAFKTARATRRCVQLCNREFGKTHHLHNRANAIRHAFWNIIILQRLYGSRSNIISLLKWTEKITTWHEDFSVNLPLERAMDLHNNAVGRYWFSELKFMSEKEILDTLKQKAKSARKIVDVNDTKRCFGRLVYLTE